MNPTTPFAMGITKLLLCVVLLLAVVCWGVRIKGKFDIWDERAKEHHDTAKKNLFDFINGLLGGVSVAWVLINLVGVDINVALNGWHLMVIYGLMELCLSAYFIILEKREV